MKKVGKKGPNTVRFERAKGHKEEHSRCTPLRPESLRRTLVRQNRAAYRCRHHGSWDPFVGIRDRPVSPFWSPKSVGHGRSS